MGQQSVDRQLLGAATSLDTPPRIGIAGGHSGGRTMNPHTYCGCCDAPPTRRVVLAALACAAAFPISAGTWVAKAAAQSAAEDERFMRMALEEARQGDFPFGAVIVRDGQVLARGRNLGRVKNDPTAHGEMVAIRRFLDKYPPTMLRGATLYTTGEPCVMCMGAILWCRISRLVFAASVTQLASKTDQIMLSSAEVAAKAPFVPITITGGVLADDAMQLFK
jgi:tRNA(adenine34) deaminase